MRWDVLLVDGSPSEIYSGPHLSLSPKLDQLVGSSKGKRATRGASKHVDLSLITIKRRGMLIRLC
jgi:hypothetical protein